MARTNIDLDDRLVQEGLRRFRCRSKRELVHLALSELIKRARRRDLLSLRTSPRCGASVRDRRRYDDLDRLPGSRDTSFDRHLVELMEEDAPIALVDIVYGEVLQGIRSDDTYHRIRRGLLAHPILRPGGLSTFERAANLYRSARRQGLTIRRSVDCLIAAMCLENGAEIYHNDRDFDALARVSPLMIYRRP